MVAATKGGAIMVRTYVVTGAAGGIGRATRELLLDQGTGHRRRHRECRYHGGPHHGTWTGRARRARRGGIRRNDRRRARHRRPVVAHRRDGRGQLLRGGGDPRGSAPAAGTFACAACRGGLVDGGSVPPRRGAPGGVPRGRRVGRPAARHRARRRSSTGPAGLWHEQARPLSRWIRRNAATRSGRGRESRSTRSLRESCTRP